MAPQVDRSLDSYETVERCPECGHRWNEVGPSHFADCRFFSLEGDRSEDAVVFPPDWGYMSDEAA